MEQKVGVLYDHVLNTAVPMRWVDTELQVASVQGLILTKLVAFRPQDQADIDSLLIANRRTFDVESMNSAWARFGTDGPL